MSTKIQERFAGNTTGNPIPATPVDLKLSKDNSVWKSGTTDSDGVIQFDPATGNVLQPGPHYLRITSGGATKDVHSEVVGFAGRFSLADLPVAFQALRTGVLKDAAAGLGTLAPSAGVSGLTVAIDTGAALLCGQPVAVEAAKTVTLATAPSGAGQSRRDAVVLRLHLDATDYGKVDLVAKTGTATTGTPDTPVDSRDPVGNWELTLASVLVGQNVTSLTSGNVSDRRTYASPTYVDPAVIGDGSVDATEFSYLNGIQGNIQNALVFAGTHTIEAPNSQWSAETLSSTNTAATVAALTNTIALGPGTWNLLAQGDLLLRHSADGACALTIEIDGAESAALTTAGGVADDVIWTRFGRNAVQLAVAGNRTVTCRLRYRPSAAGTAEARNPVFSVRAYRVS